MTNENSGNVVTTDDWRRLYAAAIKVRDMEPWNWMEGADVFGVWPAGRDTAAFVSVMGALGEYCAVAVYPGPWELHQFRQIGGTPEDERGPECVLDIAQLHAAFGGAGELEATDKQVIRELGLKFRGSRAWPCFRSFRPGYFPWFLERSEARLLTVALEQLLEVAPRARQDRSLLTAGDQDGGVLVRAPADGQADGPWVESRRVFPLEPRTLRLTVPAALVAAVRELKQTGVHLEADVFPMPVRVGKKGRRPQLMYGLLVVESRLRFVLGVELLSVETTPEDMWATVPAHILDILRKGGLRPASLAVRTPWLHMVMDAICDELGIELETRSDLSAVETVRRGLEQLRGAR